MSRIPSRPLEPPPLWLRVRAFLWDYLLILIYLIGITAIGALLTLGPARERWRPLFADPVRADVIAALLTIVPVVLYFALAESSAVGATWGKRRVGIRVVRLGPGPSDGGGLSRGRALLRALLKFVPWQVAHTGVFHTIHASSSAAMPGDWAGGLIVLAWLLALLYLLAMRLDALGRTPYDRVAGSVVTFAEPG